MKPPVHGGRLREMAQRTGIPASEWLDLSTGINPNPWPVPPIPEALWHRLPEDDDELPDIARHWAGAPATAGCVPVPGSQAAIQALPSLRGRSRVGVPMPGYREHAYRWHLAGHEVVPLAADDIEHALPTLDVLVVVQPNNPTGRVWPVETLRRWHRVLAARGGWLVVDEAFMDPLDGAATMAPHAGDEGVVVLRSLGKFFGLAGARAGLLFAMPLLCERLADQLGPWCVNGPARWLMARALDDVRWQRDARGRLQVANERLTQLLTAHSLPVEGRNLLFCYVRHPAATDMARALAERAVLVRRFEVGEGGPALRFSAPVCEPEWRQFAEAIRHSV
ncbi:cobalamin biosynthesis protein CobC [Alcanivorax sp. S71-1-4]|uniref:threonine-phosphate decarboxylase CobD n=1 Tax=Alcanivorax sp. S71-1-4 TaxID=1177159 RepID=UPI001359C358|nr:threonine-phosphate decarboxylase CobD [Alcanivorax sp. S71-1-4]KAF0810121.1 cobalamin biosynthesis protein CobC [Alcanivorax sp. S71-1-4]